MLKRARDGQRRARVLHRRRAKLERFSRRFSTISATSTSSRMPTRTPSATGSGTRFASRSGTASTRARAAGLPAVEELSTACHDRNRLIEVRMRCDSSWRCCGARARAARSAQEPPQQPASTIPVAVDLVPVDVSVIGDDGRPVTGLAAEDFTLDVDGSSRGSRRRSSSRRFATSPAAPPRPELQLQRRRRRAADHDRRRSREHRARPRPPAMEAASRFLSRLTPPIASRSSRCPAPDRRSSSRRTTRSSRMP